LRTKREREAAAGRCASQMFHRLANGRLRQILRHCLPDVQRAHPAVETLAGQTVCEIIGFEVDWQQRHVGWNSAEAAPHRGGLAVDIGGEIDFANPDPSELV
jgi:hypothetical protein